MKTLMRAMLALVVTCIIAGLALLVYPAWASAADTIHFQWTAPVPVANVTIEDYRLYEVVNVTPVPIPPPGSHVAEITNAATTSFDLVTTLSVGLHCWVMTSVSTLFIESGPSNKVCVDITSAVPYDSRAPNPPQGFGWGWRKRQ